MNRINIICLGVQDVKKSRDFFINLLGFTTPNMEDTPDIVFFSNRGTKLELYPLTELAKDINSDTPPALAHKGGFAGITLAYDTKTQDEVDAIFARVEGLGGTIAKQPRKVFWGGYSGYFTDLDGYYWEVAYFDGWKFDDNDMLVIE